MAHNLTIVNGKASMAYVGATPWHGLGQELTADAPIEQWLIEAGMNFNICRSRVRFGANEAPVIWDARHVLFRSDTKAPISIVSEDYKLVQPREVLEFFRDLCDKQGMTLETAGTLKGGAVYWALAKLPLDFTLAGGDAVKGYVLLATSADMSLSTIGKVTSTRVVCNNTLDVALGEKGKQAVKVRHSTTFKAQQVKVELGLVSEQWEAFASNCQKLSRRQLSRKEALSILIDVMGDSSKPVAEQPNARPMGEIMSLFSGKAKGADLDSAKGTAWGLVNAATEYFDHNAGRSTETRLQSSWFGANAGRKNAIYNTALGMADMGMDVAGADGSELLAGLLAK